MQEELTHLLTFCNIHRLTVTTEKTVLHHSEQAFRCHIELAEIKDTIFLRSCTEWGRTPDEAKSKLAASMSGNTIAVRRDEGREDIVCPRLWA